MTAKTAIIFPGQGAQAVGMGRDLIEVSDEAAGVFQRANKALGFDLAALCFDGPAEKLEATDIQQPAILTTSVALWQALTARGKMAPEFACTAGLSLGEYTALHVADALSFEDAVRLVFRRGQFMQQAAGAQPSGMVSIIGMQADDVRALCAQAAEGEVLQPANYNCPGQIVISGSKSACERAAALVEQRGQGRAIELKVAGAFHCPLMQSAAEQLRTELAETSFDRPRVPVISNVDVAALDSPEQIRDALYRQVVSPVRWQDSIQHMIADGVTRFIEVGPGRTLTGMMRKIDRSLEAVNISTAAAIAEFVSA